MKKKTTTDRYCRRAVALVAAGLLLVGCSGEPEEPLQPGEAQYAQYCSACHARDGSGRPPTFPPLAGSEWLELGPEAVSLIVLLGLRGEIEVAGRTYRGYMPNMRQLNDTEIKLILDYIDRQWADWARVPATEDIVALRARIADEPLLESREALERLLDEVAP
ncbi:MAG TPA: cytochrome c [Wenzhouxiangellaceae bacterium]|nr:cytochrome c [Wenzhouxiangellaceae bacterium]